MTKAIEPGDRFSRWSVVRSAAKDQHGRSRTVVRCICRTEAIVLVDALTRGNTKGCKSVLCRKKWEDTQGTNKP
jgi:hypothetical protein